ncbi:helix-turn-helix domain-containing protein [Streptomyces sp. Tu 2975]|uniref:helix-turn-helix domain-containing protein n=1 Tax=Streptomyces sp. Tu 2975 TaxID=2676871 RepID=UPI0013591B99|nr:helix-turn-helix domain-containing protein [Streptomyces sp. Tu 2975]QIP86015.1 helix-turn-helix domain-containing protein [Streptomyces sp. Tu 2975]
MAVPQLNAPLCASPPVPAVGIRHINLPHNERFVVVGNHLAQHDRLSLTAIGLSVHIQSLRTGARISVKKLAERFPEGEDRISDALNELERYGYLRRTRVRLPSGQLITTTESFNNPPAMRIRVPGQAVPVTAPVREAPPPAVEPPVPDPVVGPEPVPLPQQPCPRPRPATAHPTRTPPRPVPATLLADLRRHDPRLLLSERDIGRLAPAVDVWLERGVAPDAVRRTLTAALPAGELHRPAGLLRHRLTELLPPPLPAAPPSTPRPDPFQTCDACDLAFRAPGPGLCSACAPAAALVAS